MSRWLDAFREASVLKAAPAQLAQLGAESPHETPNCTFPTYPHQGKGGENEVPELQGADGAAEPEGAPRGADNSPYGWGEAAVAVAWFLRSEPPSEPFVLRRNPMGQPFITVLHPARYWRALKVDLAAGPGRGRDAYGAVRADVLRLYELLGGGS